ncbi:MAG TPA: tRNA pseudouridine(55) synthase TruB [Gemmataceae bacterium]|jgi:tRNA pseudouridine55 synthase|nr:tRNA pseudouridine(55) synthase TruB [Gemmataceae bacterium]
MNKSIPVNGLLVLDKPRGITSREALDRAARWFPRKTKVGHCGTLDPLATGVLVLALGTATRLVEYVQAMPKAYRTRIVLGATSDTDDADGTVTPTGAGPVTEEAVRAALTKFVGEVEQTPPAYSAARVEGQRAHSLARRGEDVALAPRRVRIDAIDVRSFAWPELEADIACGKGTYIRSIARDLGAALGVGGYVATLRRLRIGPFAAEDGVTLDTDAELARSKVQPLAAALSGLPPVAVSADDARRLRNGQTVAAVGDGEIAVVEIGGDVVGVGRIHGGVLRPEKILAR